ncbi:Creatinase/aminopeptidase [Lactarius akahatsu]|uniref:Creatinase/aminopeptidase n=1 Tax=Lactarius akahatsu TaxID=416441 RepID=A0AAD4Q8I7_9AGAM|nr:Creatinase/aminopeptidase [Lactarius akahatsu]
MAYPAQEHARKTLRKLAELLPPEEQTKHQIIVLAGSVTPYRNDTDRELPFRQESNFFYLTGCSVPSSLLLLTASSATSDDLVTTLFIPEAEPADLMWSVPPPTLDAARDIYNVTDVLYTSSFTSSLAAALQAAKAGRKHTSGTPGGSPFAHAITAAAMTAGTIFHPHVHTLPQTTQFPTLPSFPHTVRILSTYLLSALHRARLTKSAAEIAHIRRANAISSRAHEVVMRVLGVGVRRALAGPQGGTQDADAVAKRVPLPSEWLIEKEAEAEAIFVASCRREGAVHQAYRPIVAASTRAATLHYCCNDREFAWGPVETDDHANNGAFARESQQLLPQVLLIDAGCEWDNYASDITRTMPVGNGGRFTPEARAIYELVLEMQTASFKAIRPGLHWDAVQLLCHRTLVRGFKRLGIFKAGTDEATLLAAGVSAAFFPHGVGHSLGQDVHDVPSASKPEHNPTIAQGSGSGSSAEPGHEKFYEYLRLRLPLEEGMVVTVEPGIYFHYHLLAAVRDSEFIDHEVLSRYEPVGGVRIEDVVLITSDGFENLTTVRSDVKWVEGVCSGEL